MLAHPQFEPGRVRCSERCHLLTSTYYQPWPNLLLTIPKSKVHMLCNAIWDAGVWPVLTQTWYPPTIQPHWAVLPVTLLPNKYVITQRVWSDWETKAWTPKLVIFFPVLYSLMLHKKCTDFSIVSNVLYTCIIQRKGIMGSTREA